MKKSISFRIIVSIVAVVILMTITGFFLNKIGYTEKLVKKMVKAEIRRDYESYIIYRIYLLTIYMVGWYIPPKPEHAGARGGGLNYKVLVVGGVPVFTFGKREWSFD